MSLIKDQIKKHKAMERYELLNELVDAGHDAAYIKANMKAHRLSINHINNIIIKRSTLANV